MEDDFAIFSVEIYKHVTLNLALQEVWDDAYCAFAYIDKSMGSGVQVEQVIGRALRQPGAQHFNPDLPRILKSVRAKLGAEMPGVAIEGYVNASARKRSHLVPKKHCAVPQIDIDSSAAKGPLNTSIQGIIDFRQNKAGTEGLGELQRAVQGIGDGSKGTLVVLDVPHANRVTARWLVRREMRMLHPEAVKPLEFDGRFDALAEITGGPQVSGRGPRRYLSREQRTDVRGELSILSRRHPGEPGQGQDLLERSA
jgi:type III restriction enzyme